MYAILRGVSFIVSLSTTAVTGTVGRDTIRGTLYGAGAHSPYHIRL